MSEAHSKVLGNRLVAASDHRCTLVKGAGIDPVVEDIAISVGLVVE